MLVGPYAAGHPDRAQALRRALETLPGLAIIALTADIAAVAAELRAANALLLPDAIIVATSVSLDAALLTNDHRLQRTDLPAPILMLDQEVEKDG